MSRMRGIALSLVLVTMGAPVTFGEPIRMDVAKWANIIRDAHIKTE